MRFQNANNAGGVATVPEAEELYHPHSVDAEGMKTRHMCSRMTQRAQRLARPFGFDLEPVLAIGIDVFIPCGGQMDKIILLDGIPLHGERIERCCQVDGVPGHDGVGHQVQTARLVQLVLFVLPADLAFIGEKEKPAEGMEGLALVELGVDAAPILLAFQVSQDEERLDQPAVFLKCPSQRVLSGIRLQLADKERRGDPPELQGPGHAQEIVPAPGGSGPA
jgi:hypothetical protein